MIDTFLTNIAGLDAAIAIRIEGGAPLGAGYKTMGSASRRKWARHWGDRGSDRACRLVDAPRRRIKRSPCRPAPPKTGTVGIDSPAQTLLQGTACWYYARR